tara:strand:- start:11306 stop:11680 length:375 start_codon:yes stop_codon:yes gene_type:complete
LKGKKTMSNFRVEVMNGPFAVNQYNVEAEHHFGAMRLALESEANCPSEPHMNPGENYPEDTKSIQIAVWRDTDMDETIEKMEKIKAAVDRALSALKGGDDLSSSYVSSGLIAASNLLDDIAESL